MPVEIIKVCGITNVADAAFAADRGATALGFIFFPGSPRSVRVNEAAMIAGSIPHTVLRVGVFVNEAPAQIRNIVGAARLDVVQLHGEESPEMCAQLSDLRVWKAFRVEEGFDVERLAAYSCEAYFLDTGGREGTWGGSGQTFPWHIAVEAKKHGKVIVAGGLDGDNVVDAVRHVAPYGVDASSRLETKPGAKDPNKVRRYLRAAQSVKES